MKPAGDSWIFEAFQETDADDVQCAQLWQLRLRLCAYVGVTPGWSFNWDLQVRHLTSTSCSEAAYDLWTSHGALIKRRNSYSIHAVILQYVLILIVSVVVLIVLIVLLIQRDISKSHCGVRVVKMIEVGVWPETETSDLLCKPRLTVWG